MSQSSVSRDIFDMLVKHLVNIEEEKSRIIKDYYYNPSDEREVFGKLINSYIKGIEGFISSAQVDEAAESFCPFVIIGSIVELEDLQYNEVDRVQLVSPFESVSNIDVECASFISPMGQALLLKKVNDRISVATPMGKSHYLVKAIDMSELSRL